MIDFDYAARQTAGVWKMIWNREGWQTELDRSVDGVFRSFQAMLLVAPIVLAGRFSFRRAAERIPEWQTTPLSDAPYAFIISIQMLSYYFSWIVSIALLLFMARAVRASRRAGDVIIAYNWAHVPIAIAQTLPLLVFGMPGGRAWGAAAYLPALAFIVAALWGLIRRSMGATPGATAGIIALLVLSGLTIEAIVGVIASTVHGPGG